MGIPDSLLEAANFVESIQNRQGIHIACFEEIAFRSGWIGRRDMLLQADRIGNTEYGKYLGYVAGH
jgi:glucose-1-phosphate thymidylyltransferase